MARQGLHFAGVLGGGAFFPAWTQLSKKRLTQMMLDDDDAADDDDDYDHDNDDG